MTAVHSTGLGQPPERIGILAAALEADAQVAIRPFRLAIADAALDDLRWRLGATRFSDEIPGHEEDYGVSVRRLRRLVERWQHGYDWRAWEARLDAYPQFVTHIDGQDIHFPTHPRRARGRHPRLLRRRGPGRSACPAPTG